MNFNPLVSDLEAFNAQQRNRCYESIPNSIPKIKEGMNASLKLRSDIKNKFQVKLEGIDNMRDIIQLDIQFIGDLEAKIEPVKWRRSGADKTVADPIAECKKIP